MEFIAEIRRRHWVDGESISSIAQSLKRSRPTPTVRKALKTLTEPVSQRQHQSAPKPGEFQARLEQWLTSKPAYRSVSGGDFTGKERPFNRRFLTLANHYLFEPLACTARIGLGKR